MTKKMKKSMVDWIEEIPLGWEIKRFKLLFSLGKGLSITKADLVDDGIAVVSYGQIHSKQNAGTHLEQSLIRYIPETYHPVASSLLKCGDIVFADTSEDYDGIGNAVLVDVEDIVFAGYHTIWAREKEPLNSKYFAYLFKSDVWRNQVRSKASGIKVFSITQKILNETSLLIPPIKEQRAIANYLDSYCNEIDSLSADIQTEIETLEAYRSSVISAAVSKGIEKTEMIPSGRDFVNSIPSHWQIKRFKYVAKVCSNLVQPDEYMNYPQISPENIEKNTGKLLHYQTVEESGIISGNHFFKPGQILFSKIRPELNKATIAPFKGLCSADMYPIEAYCNTKFLLYAMISKYFLQQVSLVTKDRVKMPKINQEELGEIFVILPSLAEQIAIVKHLDEKCQEIDSVISSKKKQLDILASYKKSLIYEYVTGKKEVPAV